ncbi:50S ribosomal protein L22 [bacterium]|nr:50S ribosomal protein L22 [bacterium]MBU1920382.1 50S ribosomal protein L22 [bacterium]RQV99564.1 MAG: 50S ribosomal protein L22 [bacterium]
MEARCVARYIRIAPRKMRLVADAVRGKNVNEAINILKFTPRYAAVPMLKAIESAVANLMNNSGDSGRANPDLLLVKTIFADEGPTLKRFMPRAQGRATPIRKRTSHLTVVIGTPDVEEAVEAKPAAEEEAVTESKPKKITRKKKAE